MTASETQPPGKNDGVGTLILRVIGVLVVVCYLIAGSLLVGAMFIAGLFEGFSRWSFTLLFFGVCVYVYGTAYLGYLVSREPAKVKVFALAVLVLPALLFVGDGFLGDRELRNAARTYATSSDLELVAEARNTLLEQGRKSGRHGYVDELIHHLQQAETDEERIHLVSLLGKLSYQHEPLLEELRALRQATRDDPERVDLHQAVEEAILQVNPYEDHGPG